jgi:hypothetical protein
MLVHAYEEGTDTAADDLDSSARGRGSTPGEAACARC